MIVISSAFVLAETTVPWADAPLIAWDNIVTAEKLSASGSDADYPVSNLATPSTAERWKGANTSTQYLTVYTDTEDPIDYIAAAGHNWGSGAVTVSVESRTASDGTFETLIDEFIPADDSPILCRFALQGIYEIRFKLQPTATIPRAAVVYSGELLVLPTGIPPGFTPPSLNRRSQVTNGRSESGNFLGRIVTRTEIMGSVKFHPVDGDWYRENFDPFVDAAKETPFFFAWAPTSYPDEVGYLWLTKDPVPSIVLTTGEMAFSLDYAGVVL